MTRLIEKIRTVLADMLPSWKGLDPIRPVPETARETPVIRLSTRRSKIDYFDAA